MDHRGLLSLAKSYKSIGIRSTKNKNKNKKKQNLKGKTRAHKKRNSDGFGQQIALNPACSKEKTNYNHSKISFPPTAWQR